MLFRSWGRFATVLPLVALVAGLALIADRQQSEQIDTAARIDAELLGDDLPIGAYRDHGTTRTATGDLPI